MKRFQYEALLRDLIHKGCHGQRLYVMEGRSKGQTGALVGVNGSSVALRFESGHVAWIIYSRVEFVGEDDQPIIQSVRDMTGRVIEEGTWLCYSQTDAGTTHSMEIGKVLRTTPAGSIVVRPYLRNGYKLAPPSRGKIFQRIVTNASRSVVLPVDEATMTMWALKEFENLRDES